MIEEEKLDKIAIFIQKTIKGKPMFYFEVRNLCEKEFKKLNLKGRYAIGNCIGQCIDRRNFFCIGHAHDFKVLFLPDDKTKAVKMYRTYLEKIPIEWILHSKRTHAHLLGIVKDLKKSDFSIDAISIAMRITKGKVKQYIGELELK